MGDSNASHCGEQSPGFALTSWNLQAKSLMVKNLYAIKEMTIVNIADSSGFPKWEHHITI